MKKAYPPVFMILITAVWLMQVCQVNAQPFPLDEDFTLYSVREGLPDNKILTIAQDDQGFIWVGTASGLSCFDGFRFTNYNKGKDLQTSLPSDHISSLLKRPDGKIFICTINGISLLDPVNRKFTSIRQPGEDSFSKLANMYSQPVLLPNGELIVGLPTGINVFDDKLNLVYKYLHFKKEDIGKVRMQFAHTILMLSDGNCLVLGSNGMWLYRMTEHTLELLKDPPFGIKQYMAMWTIGKPDLAVFRDGLTSPDSLEIANMKTGLISYTDISAYNKLDFNWAMQLMLVHDSMLILTSHITGLFTGKLNPITLDYELNPQKHLPGYHVYKTFEDREGRLWLGTQYGLLCQSFTKQIFQHHALTGLKTKFNIDPYIQGITRFKNAFYIGIQDAGVWEFDKYFNPIKRLLKETDGSQNIWNIRNYGIDSLYIGTQMGLLSIDPNTPLSASHKIGPRGSTFYQFKDHKNFIWAGFHGGVMRYDPKKNETLIWSSSDKDHYFPYNDATGIAETDSGYIWMCGEGWHRWNPFTMTFDRSLTAVPGTEHEEGNAYQVACNGGEELIFMLLNNGLWKWKTDQSPAEKIIIDNKAFEFVEEILPDRTPHCFWLVLKAGIGYLNAETGQYRFFNELSGLPQGEIIKGFYNDPVTDSMYIGMDNGVLSFYRPALAFSSNKPEVFITSLALVKTKRFLDVRNGVKLNADDRDFTVQFSSPEYEYASSLRYEYRLSNNEWTSLEQATSARFANLGAGKYQFEVRAASPNGTISTPAILMIEILPFYYESWWFKTLILTAIAGVIFLWFRLRLTQLQKLEKMRQSIAADLHDEVGASLSSLQILAELAGQNKDPQQQNEVLSRLRTQTKKATASLREIVWNIHPKNDRLEMFVGELSRYAGEILEDAGISYSIHADPIGPEEKLAIASRQQLARVYKEILSNLVRHSNAKIAEISFTKEDHLLVISIRDNGRGFEPEKTERGNGLNNMADRMKMIDGHINIQSAINGGTKTTFSCRLL